MARLGDRGASILSFCNYTVNPGDKTENGCLRGCCSPSKSIHLPIHPSIRILFLNSCYMPGAVNGGKIFIHLQLSEVLWTRVNSQDLRMVCHSSSVLTVETFLYRKPKGLHCFLGWSGHFGRKETKTNKDVQGRTGPRRWKMFVPSLTYQCDAKDVLNTHVFIRTVSTQMNCQ